MFKRLLVAVTPLLALLVPAKAQEFGEGFEPLLQFFAAFFDKPFTSEIIILSFVLLIIFTIILSVLLIKTKIFEGFQPAAVVVAAIMAFISVRYTPLEFFFLFIAAIIILSFGAFLFMIFDALKQGVGISTKIGGMFAAIGFFVVGFLLINASEKLGGAGVTIPTWGYTLAWLCVIVGIFILVATFLSIFMGMKFGATMGGLSTAVVKKYKQRGLKGAIKALKELRYEYNRLAIEVNEINEAMADVNAGQLGKARDLIAVSRKESRREAALSRAVLRQLKVVQDIFAKEGKMQLARDANLAERLALQLNKLERSYVGAAAGVEKRIAQGKVGIVKAWLTYLKKYVQAEEAVAVKLNNLIVKVEQEIART